MLPHENQPALRLLLRLPLPILQNIILSAAYEALSVIYSQTSAT